MTCRLTERTMARVALCLLLLQSATTPTQADKRDGNNDIPLPTADDPVLAGYDLVAYHSLEPDQDGIRGSVDFSFRHTNGYLYYFANEANRQAFASNPAKYLPKYGGFCAWGIAWEYPEDNWPWAADHMGPPCGPSDGWAILDGTLYCSIFRWYQEDFNRRRVEGISLADERWIKFYGSLEAGPQNNGCYSYNWQECFDRSIHNALNISQVALDPPTYEQPDGEFPIFSEQNETTWSEEMQVMEGTATFRWTLNNITGSHPELIVELTAKDLSNDEYVAFGVAETLMQGPLVACSDHTGTAACEVLVGDGMGTTVPPTPPVRPIILASDRNETHFTVRFAASLLAMHPDARLAARVLFAKGGVSGTGAPQPHPNDVRHRQAVTGIDFLKVVEGYDVEANRPERPDPPSLEPLPDQSLWGTPSTTGVVVPLPGRRDIRVAYELYELDQEEDDIVLINLEKVDRTNGSYVGFGFAESVMSGLVITCSIDSAANEQVDCKQWRGRGTNLWPLPRDDAGGWFVLSAFSDGTSHVNLTLAGRVTEVVEAPLPVAATTDSLRAITAIGTSPMDTKNPLQHHPLDRAGYVLPGLVKTTDTSSAAPSFAPSWVRSAPPSVSLGLVAMLTVGPSASPSATGTHRPSSSIGPSSSPSNKPSYIVSSPSSMPSSITSSPSSNPSGITSSPSSKPVGSISLFHRFAQYYSVVVSLWMVI